MMVNYLLMCLSIVAVSTRVRSDDAMLQWKYGELLGVSDTATFDGINYEIHKYLGIPFAMPPVNELRFRKPEPVESMDSPFYATKYGMPCVQFNMNINFSQSVTFSSQSEDCLFLNVYVPKTEPDGLSSGHAVAIWIHGGGFIGDTGSVYNATYLSTYGNVIVVTFNYRLGLYGLLSTEDDNAPGNYALWDQHMAFQWVHDNIGYFGGDNTRVTVFGESAGAISVSYHGLITQNNGLFQRIIAQSGSALEPSPRLDLNALEDAQNIATLLGCDISTTSLLMECLRNKSNDDIIQTMASNDIMAMDFNLVMDNVLIKRDVTTIPSILNKQQLDEVEFYRSLDVMNGFNSHDGYLIVDLFIRRGTEDVSLSRDQMEATIGPILGFFIGYSLEESIIDLVMTEYTNWTNPDSYEEVRLQLVKLFGDLLYGAPVIETAKMHASSTKSSRNYVYHFVANPPTGRLATPDWVPGANHADDLAFLFGVDEYMPYIEPVTAWDLQLSRKMARYWTNFMKSGDPNQPDYVSPVWPEYDITSQRYLRLEEYTNNESIGQFCYAKEYNFWNSVFPEINKAMSDMSQGGDDCISSARQIVPSTLLAFVISFLCIASIL